MKITEQELQIRKDRIINTAFRLFCAKGIEQVSLTEIAQTAKVGNSTIFRYFRNKPLLVLATLSVLWKAIGGKLEQKVAETSDYDSLTGYEQFALWLDCCRLLYLENADYVIFSYESKLYLQRNSIQITHEQYDNLMEEIKTPCIAALEKGKQDGSIPVDRNSEDLFYAIWGALRGYIVKIVIYSSLCGKDSPWESRYGVLEDGILSSLSTGWNPPTHPRAHFNKGKKTPAGV